MRQLRFLLAIAFVSYAIAAPGAQSVTLGRPGSLKFAVIGDNGNGSRQQYELGQELALRRKAFPFEFVLMMGDNLYGSQRPADFAAKFEQPYHMLLNAGVKFYAAIGNHDDADADVRYPHFNMNGARYYTFVKQDVRFIVADTNFLDRVQLAWLEDTLKAAVEPWKIVYFHHPLYSNGDRHGSNIELRVQLEPMFVTYGVDVVMSGHDHIYERIKPQKGITYFIIGASGMLRKGGITRSGMTAAAFSDDQSFTLMEVHGRELQYQTISRAGAVVDSGVIYSRRTS
jgi:hypothetical protein